MGKEMDVIFTGGDIGWDMNRVHKTDTHFTEKTSPGGSVYYCAVGARAVLKSANIGTVGRIGSDFPLSLLHDKKIDTQGVVIDKKRPTARFSLDQYPGNKRIFYAERGASEIVDTSIMPDHYFYAHYIHLSTGLPSAHLAWIDACRESGSTATLSSDTFESFVQDYPRETREVIAHSDMLFINEEELDELQRHGDLGLSIPTIFKLGRKGAVYKEGSTLIEIPAPSVDAIETTGAGDVLAGAFLALRSQGMQTETALKQAVHIASKSVTQFGVEHLL